MKLHKEDKKHTILKNATWRIRRGVCWRVCLYQMVSACPLCQEVRECVCVLGCLSLDDCVSVCLCVCLAVMLSLGTSVPVCACCQLDFVGLCVHV